MAATSISQSVTPCSCASSINRETSKPTSVSCQKQAITNTSFSRTRTTAKLTPVFFSDLSCNQHGNGAIADSLASALQRCAAALSLSGGAQIHARIVSHGLASDVYLSSQLLHFYASCRLPDAARSVFDAVPPPQLNLFFYNVMLRGYVDSRRCEDALRLFAQMLLSGFAPNRFSFPFVFKACALLGLLRLGREVHGMLVVAGLQYDVYAASALLDMYLKCGSWPHACKLFERIPHRNVVTWNSMICALAADGLWEHALEVIGVIGDEIGVCSWNSLIAGCIRHGDGELTLEMLGLMLESAALVKPNSATFNTLLPLISELGPLTRLKELHTVVTRQFALSNGDDFICRERLLCAMVDGYAYNGCMVYACRLFEMISSKRSHSWISIISGFITCRQPKIAFDVFHQMAMQQGSQLDMIPKVSLTLLLSECSTSSLAGLEIHGYACRNGLDTDLSVNNALISMYARRGNISLSERIFARMPEKDVVSWNTMFSSYACNHDFERAFRLFHKMKEGDTKPDEFTVASILSGCGHTEALRQGTGLHGYMVKSGFSVDYLVVQNALLDMYAKCGCVEEAEKVFHSMEFRDIVSWNTMISCYGASTQPMEAFMLFEKMQDEGLKPNPITFIALLSACSHAGLVVEGLHCFQTMSIKHGLAPEIEHYTCIVDNLCRAGHLDFAYQLIKSMPMEPDDCIWSALLSGCRIHRNVVLAEVAARHLMELDPNHSGYRVLLSNVYADAKRWDNVAKVRAVMKTDGVRKFPGCSWIDVGGELHLFYTADKSHKQWTAIHFTLNGLTNQLNEEGYVPTIYSKCMSLDRMENPVFI